MLCDEAQRAGGTLVKAAEEQRDELVAGARNQ